MNFPIDEDFLATLSDDEEIETVYLVAGNAGGVNYNILTTARNLKLGDQIIAIFKAILNLGNNSLDIELRDSLGPRGANAGQWPRFLSVYTDSDQNTGLMGENQSPDDYIEKEFSNLLRGGYRSRVRIHWAEITDLIKKSEKIVGTSIPRLVVASIPLAEFRRGYTNPVDSSWHGEYTAL